MAGLFWVGSRYSCRGSLCRLLRSPGGAKVLFELVGGFDDIFHGLRRVREKWNRRKIWRRIL